MPKLEQYLLDDCSSEVQDYILQLEGELLLTRNYNEELKASNKESREIHATWNSWFKEKMIKGPEQTLTEKCTKKLIVWLKSLGRAK